MSLIEGLLIGILIVECFGKVIQIIDTVRIFRMNKVTQQRVEKWNQESVRIRKEELRELTEMAKNSDLLKKFVDQYEAKQ